MKHRSQPLSARQPKPPAPQPHRRHPVAAFIAMLTLACVTLLAIALIAMQRTSQPATNSDRPQASADAKWTVGMLRPDGLRIIVTGREDASQVLDPQQFSRPEVRHGYWIATQIPAQLNKLYCWCGCENRGIHRSNLQCFEDEMATDCPVCLGTAEIAYQMSQKGITDAAKIQAAVDVTWRP
ncbi:PCYCGC motif-containing (lipo)protein [Piscinibacter sp.]|uniref:PCYCGC motif-containing (lipo)protein n=1 Tax=Piscinibacter sp. TaxID=1903157 RepID=UPI0035598507